MISCMAMLGSSAVVAAAAMPDGAALPEQYFRALAGPGATGILAIDGACCAAFAVLGCLLPDIDSRTSSLGRYFHLPLGHRTWTHCLLAVALACVIAWKAPVPGIGGLAFGYVSHVLLDGFSQMGVCWFYPLQRYRYKEGGIWKSGSGGHKAKVAEGHRLRLYRTSDADPGYKLTATDGRGRRWLTDGAMCGIVCAACIALAAWRCVAAFVR